MHKSAAIDFIFYAKKQQQPIRLVTAAFKFAFGIKILNLLFYE